MRLSSKLAERLEKYGRYYPSPLTIQHIVEFGNYQVPAVTSADKLQSREWFTLTILYLIGHTQII